VNKEGVAVFKFGVNERGCDGASSEKVEKSVSYPSRSINYPRRSLGRLWTTGRLMRARAFMQLSGSL